MTDNHKKKDNTVSSIQFIASAGTGKTHQVTSLYTALVLGRPYPAERLGPIGEGEVFDGSVRIPCEEILMLTFARNAASEMRGRITSEIEKELERDPDRADFYWSLLRRISGAVISTIHAFGQRLISQNAISLGIAPSFRLLEDDEATRMLNESLAQKLRDSLTSADSRERAAMESVCLGRKPGRVVVAAAEFIHQCESLGVDIAILAPEEVLPLPPVPSGGDLERLVITYDEQSLDEKPNKRARIFRDSLRDELLSLSRGGSGIAVSEAAARLLIAAKGSWGREGMKKIKAEIEGRLKDLESYPGQVRARELLIHFLNFIGRARMAYEESKKEQGVLDFTDLLLKARDLVRDNPESLPELSVIIVDEAQDNSRAQNELVETIRNVTGASLILCGDVKQTIHTWRGADPGGMEELARRFRLTPVPLRTSYRSRKSILDWVNDIFREVVFDPESYDENSHLLPCDREPGDPAPAVELLLPEWEESCGTVTIPKSKPVEKEGLELTDKDLQVLSAAGDDAGGISARQWSVWTEASEERYSREARAVAARISLLCRPESDPEFRPDKIYDSDGWWENDRTYYRYRDIIILLRATSRQELYEAALRERGIPYTSGGKGRGLYFRQEVRDISSLLNMLAFPRDDLSLLAVVRSPFFSLSDEAIGVLLGGEGGPPRGYRLRRAVYCGLDRQEKYEESLRQAGLSDEVEVYRRAVLFLNMLRGLAGRLNGIDLIRRTVDLTGYDAILVGSFNGLQRLANLRAVLAELQERERREHLDLAGLARYLSTEIKDETRAPDAAVLDPSNDAVVISTVHGAKGLSSPVVFIPDLRRPPNFSSPWVRIRSSEGGGHVVTGELRVVGDEGEEVKLESSGRREAKEASREGEDDEARRLFYVAATRARDLVVLSGENSGRKGAWRGWINDYLLSAENPVKLVQLVPYPVVRAAAGPVDGGDKKQATPSSGLLSPVLDRDKFPAPESYRLAATVLSGVPERKKYETDEEFQKARREYVRTGLVNLPPAYFMSKGGGDEEPGGNLPESGRAEPESAFRRQVDAGLFGHAVLERIDYNNLSESLIRESVAIYGGDEAGSAALKSQLEAAVAAVGGMLTGVDSDKIIRELPFGARFTHDGATVIVDGAIDLLYFKDGVWHVVDYKFSGRGPADLKKKYGLQLAIYRDAVSATIPGKREREPLFSEGEGPAEFKMMIMGIAPDGKIRQVPVTDEDAGDVPARVIAAARLIREETSPRPLSQSTDFTDYTD
ncbi:MAG: UvrD-helicase domain-containing protein [Candidatus Auribacterota bacterium]|nr:UvrD-helicase domain-containing protein [Candidatus Auribacterota bacterium]